MEDGPDPFGDFLSGEEIEETGIWEDTDEGVIPRVSEDICRRCHDREEWEYDDRYDFDEMWDKGKFSCMKEEEHPWNKKWQIARERSIFQPPPDNCPYHIEHLMKLSKSGYTAITEQQEDA